MKNSKAKTSENSSDRLQASQTLQLRTRRDSTEKQFSMTDNNYRKEMNNSSDNKKNGNSGVFSTLDTVEDLSTRDNLIRTMDDTFDDLGDQVYQRNTVDGVADFSDEITDTQTHMFDSMPFAPSFLPSLDTSQLEEVSEVHLSKNQFKGNKPRIVGRDNAPEWLTDNQYLLKGYRVDYNRKRDLFKSLFSIHNETMNIWTHLIGGLLFVLIGLWVAFNYNEAKRLFNSLIEEFKSLNIKKLVTSSLEEDINPAIETIRAQKTEISDQEKELVERALYFKSNYELLISTSVNIKTMYSKAELEIVNKFFWLVAEIKKLTQHPSIQKIIPKFDATSKLLKALGCSNVIEDLAVWPILMYAFTAFFCMGASTVFHWFHPKNPTVYKVLNRLDYGSITILIWGSSVSLMYYTFFCNKFWYYFYAVLLSTSCLSVFFLSMQPWFYQGKWSKVRGFTFIGLGLFSGISIFQSVYRSWYYSGLGSDVMHFDKLFWYVIAMGASYIVGAQFYIWKIPERIKPGLFDIWMNSHSIFHAFVVAAALIHYFALLNAYSARAQLKCIIPTQNEPSFYILNSFESLQDFPSKPDLGL